MPPVKNYLAGAAGAEVSGVLPDAFLLCFFVCFFAGVVDEVAVLSLEDEGAGACANDKPATASANERPNAAEAIFFMVYFSPVSCLEAFSRIASDLIDADHH